MLKNKVSYGKEVYCWVWRDGAPALIKGKIIGVLQVALPTLHFNYCISASDGNDYWREARDIYESVADAQDDIRNLVCE